MKKNRISDVLLGVLFFGTLVALGVVTVGLSDFALTRKTWAIEILSPDVGYLRAGDPVLLHGMPAGKVQVVERLVDPVMATTPGGELVPCSIRIEARMELDLFTILAQNHEILIQDRGLLGGKLIRMESGSEGPLLQPGERVLVALATPTAWHALGSFIEENREPLRDLLTDLGDMASSANEGNGLLGTLLRDDAIRSQWIQTSADISSASTQLRQGQGTLSQLLYDEQMAEDAKTLVADLRSGAESLDRVVARVDAGEGTLGRMLTDDALYTNANGFLRNMEDVTTRMQDGEGLLGALLVDEELVNNIKEAVRQIRSVIEDFRETRPVQDLGSFIFGTF